MAKCEMCGKVPNFGYNVSHAKNHTPKRWLPNIQSKKLMVDGEYQRVKICTRCLRTLSKDKSASSR